MQILNTTNLNELRKQVQELKKLGKEEIAIVSQDDEFNRKALEIKGINIFIINEELNKKDYMKQRDSSLNEVLAKLASKNNISIGIEIEKIIKLSDIEKAKSLARLKQNLEICKRTQTRMIFITKNNKIDPRALQSILITLGASTKQAQTIKQAF